jgi:hypothetical protein
MRLFSRISLKSERMQSFGAAFLITAILFSSVMYTIQANAASVSLTATVSTSLTFLTSSSNFGTVTPGTIAWATTTLDVLTNDSNGWNVTLSGDNKSTVANNMQTAGNTASFTDQTEWIPGSATTTTGNAAVRASLVNSGNVFAFRVMTASSSNGAAFAAASWWGATDIDGTAKWAGVASSTVARQIGNSGLGSYSASNHLNTVQYYLLASASQPTGSYTAPLTYTATGN